VGSVDDPDISFGLTGNPAALADALDLTGEAGQVIIGSWYGIKEVSLELGGVPPKSSQSPEQPGQPD